MLDQLEVLETRTNVEVRLLEIASLRRTEHHNPQRAARLALKITEEGKWTVPLWVESSENLIMDGHHRLEAAIQLGLSRVPCTLLTYQMPDLSVMSWDGNLPFAIEDIMAAGRSNDLLPYKTTRHALAYPLPDASYDLDELR